MWKIKSLAIIAGTLLALVLPQAPAQAQATRTWVSGVGDDVNPCSRTAPCKTFAGAISKTAVNGEINCLDPGGFGTLTITKAITINCEETLGSVLACNVAGFNINAPATDIVTLKGIEIEGCNNGSNGINFNTGAALHLHKIQIRKFTGNGINVVVTNAAKLFVADAYITDNGGNTATNGGIVIKPGAGGTVSASIHRVQLENNSNGVIADGTSGSVALNARETIAAGSPNNGFLATTTGSASAVVVDSCTAASNGTGVNANGGSAFLRIGSSTVSGNATGVASGGGATLQSFKNNQIVGNASDGTPLNPVNSGGLILN
jgi:hypothetical protein